VRQQIEKIHEIRTIGPTVTAKVLVNAQGSLKQDLV
jgi:hypothetical protein